MPIELVYTIRDRKGKDGTTSVKLSDAAPVKAQVVGFGLSFGGLIDAIIGGIIRSVIAVLPVDISALTGNTPGADSDVEEIGAFEFVTAQGTRVKFNLPALDEVYVLDNSDELNTASPAIAAILTMFEDGIDVGGTQVQPCDIGELDIVGTLFSREAFRNSGKRRV